MTEVQSRRWAVHRGLLAALWLTLMILAMKVWVGLAIQSLSLLASSIHTLVTSFSFMLSGLTLVFPDDSRRNPWGHRQTDTILTLGVTGFVGFTGFTVLGSALQQLSKILRGEEIFPVEPINLSLIYLFFGIIAINLCLGIFGRSQARRVENSWLGFSVGMSLQDTAVMIIVTIGLIGSRWAPGWLDPILSIGLIGVAIANGWRVLNHQIPSLVRQVAIAPEAITNTIRRVEGILHCYGIQSQGLVGRWIYVEMTLMIHPDYFHLSNTIIHQVQQAISQDYGSAHVVVHIERDSAKQIPHGNRAPLRG